MSYRSPNAVRMGKTIIAEKPMQAWFRPDLSEPKG
jgi:hypothetical protein